MAVHTFMRHLARPGVFLILAGVVWLATGCASSAQGTAAPVVANGGHHAALNTPVPIGTDWQMTVTKMQTSSGAGSETPGGGNTYLICTLAIVNRTNQSQDLYTVTKFTLQATDGHRYTSTPLSFVTAPDGTIAPHATVTGALAFEVPIPSTQFTLIYQASDGEAFWDLKVPTHP